MLFFIKFVIINFFNHNYLFFLSSLKSSTLYFHAIVTVNIYYVYELEIDDLLTVVVNFHTSVYLFTPEFMLKQSVSDCYEIDYFRKLQVGYGTIYVYIMSNTYTVNMYFTSFLSAIFCLGVLFIASVRTFFEKYKGAQPLSRCCSI